jgi:hypothetical protein
MLGEACIAHVALERLGPGPLRAKATPFLVTTLTAALVVHAVFGAHTVISTVSLMACHRLERSTWVARSET